MSETAQSYAHGTSARAAARPDDRREPGRDRRPLPRPRGARRALPGRAAHLRGSSTPRSTEVARGLLAARPREGRPGRDLEPEQRRVGAGPVRHGAHRRDPRQHQPGLPHPRGGVRAAASRAAGMLVAATEFKTSDYVAMVAEVRPTAARRSRRVVFLGTPDWDELAGAGRHGRPRPRWPSARGDAAASTTRSTSSTRAARPASRRAPRSATTTSSTTATSSARAAATPRPTGCASPCPSTTASGWCSGNLGLHHATAPRSWCRRRPSTRRRRCRRCRPSAARASTACRRCSSPSWPIPTSTASTCRRCAPGSWPARRARSR